MDSDDFISQKLQSVRRSYLITYSQADLTKFATRESFGTEVENFFNMGSGKVKVSHWACCLEPHKNEGHHYHMSIKLTGPKRWIGVKEKFSTVYGAVFEFL